VTKAGLATTSARVVLACSVRWGPLVFTPRVVESEKEQKEQEAKALENYHSNWRLEREHPLPWPDRILALIDYLYRIQEK
jgi:hypothetical protein